MTAARRSSRRRRPWVAAAALTCVASLSACGLGTAGGFAPTGELAGPIADVKNLDGASFAVGSKNFSEQLILGKIAVILLKSAGADVQDLTNIPGSSSARQAQLDGQVNVSWEYTGTAWVAYLGKTDPIPDSTKQYTAVRDEDGRLNDLTWLKPAPMNNTYGFAMKRSTAKQLGITKLSELSKVPASKRSFCVESEFANRNDGFEPMLKKYGLKLGSDVPSSQVKKLDTGAIYAATDDGLCSFGEVFTTDGRIKALDLVVLEDDRKFFPNYNVSLVVNGPQIRKYPQLRQLFGPVSAKLDDPTLIELNRQVDVDGREPATVAEDWLKKSGFIE